MWYHNTHISITLTATNRLTERIVILAVNSGQQPPPLFTCGNARRLTSANTLADSRLRTHTIHPHHTCCRLGWPGQLQGVTVLRYLESSCNSERSDLIIHRSHFVRGSSFVTSPVRKFNPAPASLNPSPAVWKCSKAQLFFQNGNIPIVKNQL